MHRVEIFTEYKPWMRAVSLYMVNREDKTHASDVIWVEHKKVSK